MSRILAATVLVLEDQPLIVLDLEDCLVAEGFEVIGCLSSCEAALEWLQKCSPDVVVLDIELRDGVCADVARVLSNRQIPFVVHSGSARTDRELDPVFQRGQWVSKPSREQELVAAVRDAVRQRAA
jgi:DNA-binding response OmpR family regulator